MNSPSKSPIPAQERRTSERFSPDPAPRCRLVPEGLAELPAVLLDLCSGGASLSVGPVLMAGQPLLLRLSRAGLPPLVTHLKIPNALPAPFVIARIMQPPRTRYGPSCSSSTGSTAKRSVRSRR